MEKKGLGLLLAAAAAYGYYRYSKMTPEQKNALKEKGKKIIEENFGFKNMFSKPDTEPSAN